MTPTRVPRPLGPGEVVWTTRHPGGLDGPPGTLAAVWVLPDVVGPDPVVVFCAMAGAESSRARDHHYEGQGNSFHESLHLAGLAPRLLSPAEEHLLPTWGLGLTDLVHHRDPERLEVDELAERVARWAPEWLAVTGKGVAAALARAVGERPPALGPAPFAFAGAPVFVLPGTSGANRRHDYDGRPTRLAWWRDLAALVGRSPAADTAADAAVADRGPVFDGVRVGRPATGALLDAGFLTLDDLPADLAELLVLHGVGPRAVVLLQEAVTRR